MDTTKTIDADLQLVGGSALESMQRAEVDVQISTAHKYPRSMQLFKKRAIEMATLDEETAASCIYSRPVGGGKYAEGLSIRTAEIVGAAYGNLRVGAMLIEQTERFVKARGFAHDLESNFASTSEVIESTVKRDGTPYDERMRIVIAKSALAKARRDATFQVVPKALCKPIEAAARMVAIGDATTITKRRDLLMSWISKLGIEPARVFAAVGVKGIDEVGLDELTTLTGLKTAIKDGEVKVDEAFPQIISEARVGRASSASAASEILGEKQATTAKEPAPKAEPAHDAETPAPAETPKAGPTPASLLKDIEAKRKSANIAKSVLAQALVARGLMDDGVTLENLTAEKLASILDRWDEEIPEYLDGGAS